MYCDVDSQYLKIGVLDLYTNHRPGGMSEGSTQVEKASRARIGDESRGDDLAEWEVFLREDEDAKMTHVGSVSAATAEAAHEHASKLFGWFASDVWICPAEEMHRFSTHSLGPKGEDATPEDGTEPRTHEF